MAGVTAGVIMTIGVAAYAASMTISGGSIGTSANLATQPCSNNVWTWGNAKTRFAATNRYEIASVDLTVSAGCDAPSTFRMVVMNDGTGVQSGVDPVSNGNAAPNDGWLSGTASTTATAEVWTSGQGPLLNNISNSDSDVRFWVMIRG